MSDFGDNAVSAPLQGLSANNHGPWVVVCAYIFLIVTLVTIFIKISTRFKALNGLTTNDWYILLSGFFAIFQTITITIAVNKGLGRRQDDVSDSNFESFEKSYYAANILLIVALAASKTSVTYLVIAIEPTRALLYSCYAVLGFVAAWAVASILALAFQCNLPHPWNSEGNTCVDQFGLNIGIHSLNVLTDLAIIIIPFVMMQKVRVSPRKRFVVSGLFATRVVVPVFTILMLVHMKKMYKSEDTDFTWTSLLPQVWAQIVLNASIISACLPSLKPFLADIKPGLTMIYMPDHELTSSYGQKSRPAGNGNTAANKSGAVSRLTSRLGMSRQGQTLVSSNNESGLWGEKQKTAVSDMERGHNRPGATRAVTKVDNDRSESVKGLTDDIILHSVDYRVEYEDHRSDPDADLTDRSESSNHNHR